MSKHLLRAVTTLSILAVALAFAAPVRGEEAAAKPEKPKRQQFTGEITKLDAATKSITLKNAKGDEKTFTLTEKAKISTKDKEAADWSDLKQGEKVTAHYTMQDGKAMAGRIAPPESKKKEKAGETK